MLKAIIFDMDGVLLDSESLHYQALDELMQSKGRRYSVELLHKYCGVPEEEIWPRLLNDLEMADENPEQMMQEHWILYRRLLKQNGYPEFPGTREFLMMLKKRGYRTAVASASSKEIIGDYLQKLGLKDCFDAVTSAQECRHGKPEPDVFLLAAEKLRIKPKDCIVIEDSVKGMIAARRAGMKWIGFEGAKVKPDMRYAVYKFSDYRIMTAETLEQWYRSFPGEEQLPEDWRNDL